MYNGSKRSITLEYLTSFAIRHIPADKVHRLQSFWSAEGKLRTETVEELHLEPSMMELCSQASFSDAHEIPSIPLIAANMHRVILLGKSQIWAVLRAGDSLDRIHYSLTATLFGRMCLSGDIYDLTQEKWQAVEEGMDFYRKCADIIRDGTTICHACSKTAYNAPRGQQLVVRALGNRRLAILHRFQGSRFLSPKFTEGSKVLAEYGEGQHDFSAKAWLYEAE